MMGVATEKARFPRFSFVLGIRACVRACVRARVRACVCT